MHSTWIRVSKGIDTLNEKIGEYTSLLNVGLIVLVCFDVIYRYLLNRSYAWLTELEWHFFALIFLLGAGYSWRHNRHVRVDLFYDRFGIRDRALVDAVGSVVFLIPWSLTFLAVSWNYAMASFGIREASPDPGGLPAFYPIKFAVPLGMLLLFLQGIANLIKNLEVLFTGAERRSNEPE